MFAIQPVEIPKIRLLPSADTVLILNSTCKSPPFRGSNHFTEYFFPEFPMFKGGGFLSGMQVNQHKIYLLLPYNMHYFQKLNYPPVSFPKKEYNFRKNTGRICFDPKTNHGS